MLYLANTFTLGMLKNKEGTFKFRMISLEEARELVNTQDFVSCVGHQATSILMSQLLQKDVPFNRIQISCAPGDNILVCQLLVRLEEGKILTIEELTKLYNDGKIAFYFLEVL